MSGLEDGAESGRITGGDATGKTDESVEICSFPVLSTLFSPVPSTLASTDEESKLLSID